MCGSWITRDWVGLMHGYTESIIVLHKGKRVYERNIGAMPTNLFLSTSPWKVISPLKK